MLVRDRICTCLCYNDEEGKMWLKSLAVVCGCGIFAVSLAADDREAFIQEYLQQNEAAKVEQATTVVNDTAAPEETVELPETNEFSDSARDEEEVVADAVASEPSVSETADNDLLASTIDLPTEVKSDSRRDQTVTDLQLRLAQLEDRVTKLEKEQLRAEPLVCAGNGTVCRVVNRLRESMGVRNFVWTIAAILVILLALLVYLITRYNRTSVISIANYPKAPESDHTAGEPQLEPVEADDESHAAALNLARAYIDMGKLDGARELLETVVRLGNEREQTEAKKLLAKLVGVQEED